MGGYWVVYKIKSGSVIERIKAWRSGTPRGPRRKKVKGSSGLKKIEANLRAAVKHLARVLNCNVSEKWLLLTLKYDDAHLPDTWQDQEKTAALFIRRLKKQLKGLRVENVPWISLCSDKNGKTGEQVRKHVHVVISGEGITFRDGGWWAGDKNLEEIWGLGSVYGEPLHRMKDYTPLAIYLLRQAGTEADRKKWHCSRNLKKPQVEEYVAQTGRELRAPAGAIVTEKQYDALQGVNYVRYIQPDRRAGKAHDRE